MEEIFLENLKMFFRKKIVPYRTVKACHYKKIKTGVEILFTPVTYRVVGFLKQSEHEDYYDQHANFNPFARS